MEERKKKNALEDFIATSKGCSYIKNCSKNDQCLKCICQDDDGIGYQCFKCAAYVHHCLEKKFNRGKKVFQCASCINKALDPLYVIKKVFVESYFKTQNIFEFSNQIIFQFFVGPEDLFYPIELRSLKPGCSSLSYPMQGSFYINQDLIYQLRPLRANSNRKTRREQFITIPQTKLKLGINYIRFKIPVLDKERYIEHYQYDEHGLYYISINSVVKLTNEELIKQTFAKRRLDKSESLALLTEDAGEIQVTQSKLSLVCPYTKERIKIPIRGRYCKHFSCVCLETLIASHLKSRFWGCPLCEFKITQPFVDIWIYGMLKDNTSGTAVIVQRNGSYTWTNSQQEALSIDSGQYLPGQIGSFNEEEQSQRQIHVQEQQSPQFSSEINNNRANLQSANIPQQSAPFEPASNSIPFELEEVVQNRAEEVRKMILAQMKEKVIQAFKKVNQREQRMIDESQQRNSSSLPEANQAFRLDKVVQKDRFVLKEVKEVRVKEQSYDLFRKRNLGNQLAFSKKIDSFLQKHSSFKYIFRDVIL